MNSVYNLIEEEWIPCRNIDGTITELGIMNVLGKAHEILDIRDQSPLVAPSVTRILLAILHRNFGPKTEDEWKDLWNAGRFDIETIDDYLTLWSHRFNLFDTNRPIYQAPGFKKEKTTPMNKLAMEMASGNNPILFDHSQDNTELQMVPAEAARMLITHQSFALGGTIAGYKKPRVYTTHATMAKGAIVMLQGANLFETLVLNMIQYYPDGDLPFPATDDMPSWEKETSDNWGQSRMVMGYLDYLTWQNRTIRLLPEMENGNIRVSKAYLAEGVRFQDNLLNDPMMLYRIDKMKGALPLKFSRIKDVWRNSQALLMLNDAHYRVPSAFRWVSRFVSEGTILRSRRYNIGVYGLGTDKAKIHFWDQTSIPLPMHYLDDKELVLQLGKAIGCTEDVSRVLRKSTYSLARHVLSMKGQRNPDYSELSSILGSLDSQGDYWASIEIPFYHLMTELPDYSVEEREKKIAQWVLDDVKKTAESSFNRVLEAFSTTGRSLKAVTLAKQDFDISMYKQLESMRRINNET